MQPPSYFALTRTATYSVLASLPLFVLYEGLVRLTAGATGVRVGADVWIKQALAAVGVHGTLPLLAVAALVGAALVMNERRRMGRIPLVPRYFGGMLAESAVYALVAGFVVAQIVAALFLQAGAHGIGVGAQLALSLGAGLYEELVFRVLLVGGLAALLRAVWTDRRAAAPAQARPDAVGASLAELERLARGPSAAPGSPEASTRTTQSLLGLPPGTRKAYAVAALVGALVFSAVHYVGAFGDPFALPSFTFRFLLGLVLNGLYLTRGFGVAAWTHALYDVFVTLAQA